MGFLPPVRKFQYVLAVARYLHFRKAAEKLHVSQPNISRQVREYEQEVGFDIFLRDHHFVSLTKAGHSLVSDIDAILARLEIDLTNAVHRALAISRETPSEYVVAHSPYAPKRIRRIALDLQRENSDYLPMRFRILSTAELLNAIDSDIVQVGITFAPVNHEGITSIPLGNDHWVAIVPAHSRFSEMAVARIRDFKGEPIISTGVDRTHPALFRKLEREWEAKGFLYRTIAEVASPHEAFDLVEGHVGIAILPAGVCEGLPHGVRAIRVSDVSPLETVLVCHPDNSAFTQQFAEKIRTTFSQPSHGSDAYPKSPEFTERRKPPTIAWNAKTEELPKRSAH